MNKRAFTPNVVMCTTQLPGLDQICTVDGVVEIGARVNLRDLELYMRDLIPEFYKMLWIFGSPQIRSAGTLAGNIANASPIGDSIPFLMIADAGVEVTGVEGTRRIKCNELYKGYKILALKADEIITRIFIPIPAPTDLLKLYKVSRREHLDISTFSAAIRIVKDGNKVKSASIAYGGVGPVVVRLKKTEQFLQGKEFDFQTFASAGKMAREEVTPISDVRGSSEFRFQLAENIMLKFFYETADERALSCL
jgi:xanthine dehydrogenase small subunit